MEKSDAVARFRYAEMLREGCGVAKNVREAVTWTSKAADGGLAIVSLPFAREEPLN